MSELKISEQKVSTAVDALLKIGKKSEDKNVLLDEVEKVHLQICLKKIPPKEKIIKLKLPNSLKQSESEVCLFVKDSDRAERDYEPTVRHFQDLLQKYNVECVSEIIPLKSLKTEYTTFEAKRNLSNAYDIFLADERIVRLLPTYLGKFFYGKNGRKKLPIPVNLSTKHLAHEIATALSESICCLGNRGSSSFATVAAVNMDLEKITENILASVKQLAQGVPGGPENIKQLSLKTNKSISIPLYLSAGGPQSVTIQKDRNTDKGTEAEELSTMLGTKVKVFASGHIKVIKEKDGDEDVPLKRPRYSKKKAALKKKGAVKRLQTKVKGVDSKAKQTKKTSDKKGKKSPIAQKPPAKKRKTKS